MSEKSIDFQPFPALGDKPSINDQIHYMAYHYGKGPTTPKFLDCNCPNCESEFVQVVRENAFEKGLICHNCMTGFTRNKNTDFAIVT